MLAKTEYKSFDHIKHPVVLVSPVHVDYYLFGNTGNKSRSEYIGDIFIVYDTEAQCVWDWVYFPGRNLSYTDRIIPVTVDGKTKYYNSCFSSKVVCMDPAKTSLECFDAPSGESAWMYGSNIPYFTRDFYGRVNERKKYIYNVNVFDCEKKSFIKKHFSFLTDTISSVYKHYSDGEGNIYFIYMLDKYGKIAKINCKDKLQN